MSQVQYQLFPEKTRFEVVKAGEKGNRQAYGVVTIPSSDGKREYRVDVSNGRCDCPAWKFSKTRQTCKHLRAMGFVDLVTKAKNEVLL
jgi:hypothetical protein